MIPVDIAVYGGGLAACYHYGLLATLAELERTGLCRVRCFYAVSAGAAMCAAFLCFGDPTGHYERIRSFAATVYARRRMWLVDAVSEWLERELPPDAHVTCSGRLFVTYIDTEKRGRRVVGAYATRADLIRAIVVSCSLPGVCAPLSCVRSRWDGLVPLAYQDADIPLIWGAMPPVYATLALNLPLMWWAVPARLAMPSGALWCAVRDGFSPERVATGALVREVGLGTAIVRAAADAALAHVALYHPQETTQPSDALRLLNAHAITTLLALAASTILLCLRYDVLDAFFLGRDQ
jgi:hypothetical protein